MSTARITLVVSRIPGNTPEGATIAIASNVGGWNPAAPPSACTRDARGFYRMSLQVPVGTALEYKMTRGDWGTVEKAADGSELPNRVHQVKGNATLHVHVARWADAGPPGEGHTTVGTVEELEDVASPELGNRRDLFVYLPPSYAPGTRRFPVLYLHDGQNVFDAATSFSGEWGADEAAEALAQRGRELIIVAVANNEDRMKEYAPFPGKENDNTPRGQAYADFLALTVKPLIDARFRTIPDRAHTGILGSSMGGLISLYAALVHPNTFGFVGAMSPSFWFGGFAMYDWVKAHPAPPMRIYLDVGTAEHGESPAGLQGFVRDTQRMAELLRTQGHSVHFEADEGAMHTEGAWRARLPGALRMFHHS